MKTVLGSTDGLRSRWLATVLVSVVLVGGCSDDRATAPEAASQSPSAPPTNASSLNPETADSIGSREGAPPAPVDLAAACVPWLQGGPAEGLEEIYAKLLAAKHADRIAAYRRALEAWVAVEGKDDLSALKAQLDLIQASHGLRDEAIVRVLGELAGRGFDLYLPEVLADAEKRAGLSEGDLAKAIGLPEGFDPVKVRRGMLAFSAQAVADALLSRGYSRELVAALLREDDEAVRRGARRLLSSALAQDLAQRNLPVPESLADHASRIDDPAGLISLLSEEARAAIAPADEDPRRAADTWIVAAMGLASDTVTPEELTKFTDALWNGMLFWVAYTNVISLSLPLPVEAIGLLRSDEEWGNVPRSVMHAAIFAFLGLPDGQGAAWLGFADADAAARLCQQPLWDSPAGLGIAPPDQAVLRETLDRWESVVREDVQTWAPSEGWRQ